MRDDPGAVFDTRVTTSVSGTITDLAEIVALAESGLLDARIERFGFDKVETAYQRLWAHKIEGRAIVVM
ncbi:MAG TPA: hypothetical protein DIC36_06360 [Gammaproteobacteria bacterium]|nr:hypothetical protein [Gammaproteobacteria bacterium]